MTIDIGGSALLDESPDALHGIDFSKPGKTLYLIGLIDRGVERELATIVAPHELSISEYAALSVLRYSPGLSNAELARRALVTPQSMNEVIARLEKRGLVARRQHPEHGRIRMAELTDAGRAKHTEAQPSLAELEDRLFEGIPADEVPVIRRYLLGVLSRLVD